MKLLIVADNLKVGGGRVVGLQYLRSITELVNNRDIYAVLPSTEDYIKIIEESGIPIQNVIFVKGNTRKQRFIWLLTKKINRIIKKQGITKVINLTNIPLIVKKVEQVLLIHKAFLVLDLNRKENINITTKQQRKRLFLEQLLLRGSLRYVSKVIVQTNFMKDLFTSLYQYDYKDVAVIPSGVEDIEKKSRINRDHRKIVLFVPANDYKHKNLSVLLEVAKIAKSHNDRDISFVLTLNDGLSKVIETVRQNQLDDYFVNLGPISYSETQEMYYKSSALIMPTLLESFCLPLVEAIHHDTPILVSNLPFAKEICGDKAIYFDPFNAKDIYMKINYLRSENVAINKYPGKNPYIKSWRESTIELLKLIE